MAKLVFGMNVSLDGYVDHEAFRPDAELMAHFIAQTRSLAGSFYGRGIYEIMRYWDQDDPDWTAEDRDFAAAWRGQPKWVASRTLTSVGPNATLVDGDVAAFARKLKAELDGDIDVVGPTFAQSLTDLGLIDEYCLYLHPVVLGEGTPFFAKARPPLRLADSQRIGPDVIRLAYVPT